MADAFRTLRFFWSFLHPRIPAPLQRKRAYPETEIVWTSCSGPKAPPNSRPTQRAPTIRLTRDVAPGPTFRAAASTSVGESRPLPVAQAGPGPRLSLPCEHTRPWEGFLLPNDYQLSRTFSLCQVAGCFCGT